jgi:hypothetical protein
VRPYYNRAVVSEGRQRQALVRLDPEPDQIAFTVYEVFLGE